MCTAVRTNTGGRYRYNSLQDLIIRFGCGRTLGRISQPLRAFSTSEITIRSPRPKEASDQGRSARLQRPWTAARFVRVLSWLELRSSSLHSLMRAATLQAGVALAHPSQRLKYAR